MVGTGAGFNVGENASGPLGVTAFSLGAGVLELLVGALVVGASFAPEPHALTVAMATRAATPIASGI